MEQNEENKYQEAFDRITRLHKENIWFIGLCKDVPVIQELIDNYSKLEKACNVLCATLERISVNESLKEIMYNKKSDEPITKEKWKEWAMKEASKNEEGY